MDEFEYVAEGYCLLCRHTWPLDYGQVRFSDSEAGPFVVDGLCEWCTFAIEQGATWPGTSPRSSE